jgi:hypothetical protein
MPTSTPDRLKMRFQASVAQGLGRWLDGSDRDLGDGIFSWNGAPSLQVYERGLVCGGDSGWRVRFDEIADLKFLSLRELMIAGKNPQVPVEVSLVTAQGPLDLRIPLYHYTTLASFLPDVVRPARK